MQRKARYQVPRTNTSTLIAFESAARLGSVSRAARELGKSQSALSQRIAALERQLRVRLFDRSSSGVALTEAGQRFRDATVAALGLLHAGAEEAARMTSGGRVVIACSHDASCLQVMPHLDALQGALGGAVQVRLLTYQRHIEEQAPAPLADVVLSWRTPTAAPEDWVLVMEEEIRPICSPGYAATHSDTVYGPSSGWGRLTLLDLKRPNLGWATWQDWFGVAGEPESPPRYEDYDSYSESLQAAAAGRGMALGWRLCMGQYIESGTLVSLGDGYARFPGRFTASLSPQGRKNALAHKCLEFFGSLAK